MKGYDNIDAIIDSYRPRFEEYARQFADNPSESMQRYNNCLAEIKQYGSDAALKARHLFNDCLAATKKQPLDQGAPA